MHIDLDRKNFSAVFLKMLSSVTDVVSFSLKEKEIYAIASESSDIIYATQKTENEEWSDDWNGTRLNLSNVSALSTILAKLPEDSVRFDIKENRIEYKSDSIKFKFFLLDDSVVPKVAMKKEKIDALAFDFIANIDKKVITQIVSGISFSDTDILGFYTKNEQLWVTVGDPSVPNKNEIELLASEDYQGEEVKIPMYIKIDYFKRLSSLKYNSVKIAINTQLGIVVLIVGDENVKIKLIIPSVIVK